jgi:DNA-binding winged helix-turn-helix (wHTH) protein
MTGDADYRFGEFQLLVRRQLLVYAGVPVRVGTRALAILTGLVQGEGDLVTKEKLIAAAWPNTFVEDSNLKVNIANLRRALATHDPGQDYIATVPGRGYRFIAPVHRISCQEATESSGQQNDAITVASRLPPMIPLIGRADNLVAVQEWLSENSVVTVVGPGGIEKTVLAIAAAHAVAAHYPHGVWVVDLAKISAVQFIPTELAFALGLRTGSDDPLAGTILALQGRRASPRRVRSAVPSARRRQGVLYRG